MDDLAVCYCGHVYDEHDDGTDCWADVDGERCMCFYFEEDENAQTED